MNRDTHRAPRAVVHGAVDEIKTRARVRLNAARREGRAGDLRLADCLNAAGREVGFLHFEHARRVLAGEAAPGEDWGDFWHAPRTGVLLNQWFARLADAVAMLAQQPSGFLLPYRRQFLIVQDHFIRELGVDPQAPQWAEIRRDLVGGYGTPAWHALAARRIRAPASTFAAR